ncbi:MAG: hypothetical protein JNM56_39575 [Planctomycetia bacterium]|nr:hypothetical protein [Planctomycetia bacterium]
MALKLTKHECVRLKDLPEFSEVWLHNQIKDDTGILGLEDELEVVGSERNQHGAGRLDLLLEDRENDLRYEVEIMLGATDPSHIVRCIEYWDIERRRYPAYDHVAVLVAEDITSRFLNVMSLLAGSIPLVAIQLNALKVGDQVLLHFVKVLDQRALRRDDTADSSYVTVDRGTWERRVGSEIMKLCDRCLSIANEVADPKLELKYLKKHLGICPPGSFFNVAALFPKKDFLALRVTVEDSEEWVKKLDDAGLDVKVKGSTRITVRLRPDKMSVHEPALRELIHQAVQEF